LNILVSTLGLYLFSTSSSAFPHTRSRGGVGVSLATTTATQRDTPISSTDRFSVKSTYLASDLERDSKVEQYPTSDSPDSKAEVGLELGLESRLPQAEAITLAADPGSVLPDLPNTWPSVSIIRGYSSGAADSV